MAVGSAAAHTAECPRTGIQAHADGVSAVAPVHRCHQADGIRLSWWPERYPGAVPARAHRVPSVRRARGPITAVRCRADKVTSMSHKVRPYLFYDTTSSVCTTCLRVVEAKILIKGESVYLEKWCPAHGTQRVLVADDAGYYRS